MVSMQGFDTDAEGALMALQAESEVVDQHQRDILLKAIGYDPKKTPSSKNKNTQQRAQITDFHQHVRNTFKESYNTDHMSARDVLSQIKQAGTGLNYLLSKGRRGKTLLHLLLTPESDETLAVFDRFKPLIRFLLSVCPDLPLMTDKDDQTPLFSTMEPEIDDADLKSHIVQFLCADPSVGGLASSAAIESLGMKEKGTKSHALHMAIQEHVFIDKAIVASRQLCSRLVNKAGDGMTCLHKAVTPPYSDCKRHWAEILVETDFTLLEAKGEIREEVEEDDASEEMSIKRLTALQLLAETKQKEQDDDETEENDREKARRHARPISTVVMHNHGRDKDAALETEKRREGVVISSRPISVQSPESLTRIVLSRSRTEVSARPKAKRVDQWNDLDSWLKHYCLTKFDNATVRNIIYRQDESTFIPP